METKQHNRCFRAKSNLDIIKKACFLKSNLFFDNKVVTIFLTLFLPLAIAAQTLPQGFVRVQVTDSLSKPTAMAIASDGRIFVAQQNGIIRLIKNGSLLATPFLQLNVPTNGERGLIGLTLDPDFAVNRYVYLYYTLPDGSRNRISRFTANGDVAVAGSESVILNLDPLSSATIHNGGAMQFGPDGMLYVAVGDNATPSHAQNLDTYHGKLLRINKDGTVPLENPFTGSVQKSRVWAYGLRNPYTFGFQPGTGRLFVNDVGQSKWEEINDATFGGKNFGWPLAEGISTNTSLVNPVYAYPNGTGDGAGCAIAGGVFFNPATTNYPKEYWGGYFFLDYCNQWISYLNLSGSTASRQPFATSLGSSLVYIDVGKDGNLYYLQRNTSSLFKIVYTDNSAPAIVGQPHDLSVSEGRPATFSVTATGSMPLHYQWQKNGINITNATSSSYTISNTQASDAGAFRVIVSNAFGNVSSNSAQLMITSANQVPKPTILTPAEGALYRGGDTIRFSGDATDAEDGSLPASAFSWSIDFHHDTHVHDGPPIVQGAKSGYYLIPQSGEVSDNVWYRLKLTVSDSKGAQQTAYRNILPRKSAITLNTLPAGLQISLDGQPLTTQTAVNSVEGIKRTIGILAPQPSGIKIYDFDRWLHGGAATQTIVTPVNDITYTAVYKESPFSATRLEAESAQFSGAVVSSVYPGFTGSGFVDYINASGDFIDWSVNAATAGSYEISFRYALATAARSLQIQVNGKTISSALSFPTTGSWSTWSDVSLSVHLNAGANKIRAIAIGKSGPNMDNIVVTPQTLQAENALLSGVKTATNHQGYTGAGFADYINAKDDYIEWLAYKHTSGTVTLSFRYANGSSANRPLQLQVNGVVLSSGLAFAVTGGWDQWSNTTITAKLNAGINRLKLTAIGSNGANIDYLRWSSNTSSTSLQAITVAGNIPTEDVEEAGQRLKVLISPNPALHQFTIRVDSDRKAEKMTLSIIDDLGRVIETKTGVMPGSTLQVGSAYRPGYYVVEVVQGDKRKQLKLIKAVQ